MSKQLKKVTTLSAAKRSAISRKAANTAWRTMHSAGYKRAAASKNPKKAIRTFLSNRRAA